MRKVMAALAIVLVIASGTVAEEIKLPGNADPVDVTLAHSTETATVLRYDLGVFNKSKIDISGQEYYYISLGDESNMKTKGFPELPNICRSIIIPDDAKMSVDVVSSKYIEFKDVQVAPSKGILLRTVNPADVPYEFDEFYNTDKWFPETIAHAGDPYIMRDFRGMVVEVNPFQYNPATGTLRVHYHIEVEVTPQGPGETNVLTYRPSGGITREFAGIYRDHFLNFDELSKYTSVGEIGNMLVICYDSWMSELASFVNWKRQMGIPCEIVSVTDAGGSYSGIDTYIDNYYADTGVAFVLLVGDIDQVPAPTAAGGASDPTYSLTSGSDTYPDLFVGRFSAENTSELATQVLRTMEYERYPQPGAAWYHKGTGIASDEGPGDDGEDDWEHVDNIRTDLLGFTYTEVDQIYDPGATASMVSTALNNGRSIVNYCGHGYIWSWSTTGFGTSNINSLTNDNMLPFIISVACNNGEFDGYTCFAETWLRATNGSEPTGAIGVYASSISQSWYPPMAAQDEVVDLLIADEKRTFGGLCYNGSCLMMDEYGYDGQNMFLTWTIFGDPSLRVRTDTPSSMTVVHASTVAATSTSFQVEVAGEENALCSLYGNGTLYGSAFTNASGIALIDSLDSLPAGDTLLVTVTSFNRIPYEGNVQVLYPAVYTIDPDSLLVGVPTDVDVTVLDGEGYPKTDIIVTIDGWGIPTSVDTTDTSGVATFSLDAPYGEILTVTGRETGESYDLFSDVLPVTGAVDLASADIYASAPSIGLFGSLAPHYPGNIRGTSSETGFDIYAIGCGVDASANSGDSAVVDLQVTPMSSGIIEAAIAKDGFNVYNEDITVEVVYGTMAGAVYESGGGAIVGASLVGYEAGADTSLETPVFTATSEDWGEYTVSGELEVGYYDVYVSSFGYLTEQDQVFVQAGANDFDFYLDVAPQSTVSGTVTELGTGVPLNATVKVYRTDTMELYTQTTSDSSAGGHYELSVPYFTYIMRASAYHHMPESQNVVVDEETETVDFELEATLGHILVLDNSPDKIEQYKRDLKGNVIDQPSGRRHEGRSATQIAQDLSGFGYDVVSENSSTSDPGTWTNYDFIVSASGDNTEPLASGVYRSALENYVSNGGKLLIEGGEVGYDVASNPGYPSFATDVLHADDWDADSAGDLQIMGGQESHPIVNQPNSLPSSAAIDYTGYGDQDAMNPTTDAYVVMDWQNEAGRGGVIVYDDNPAPQSAQVVFYSFNYLALTNQTVREDLLENTAEYLTAFEGASNGSISGRVTLFGETDHSGVLVSADDATDMTDVNGDYELTGLYPATYDVIAVEDGYENGVAAGVVVEEGQQVVGIDFTLHPVIEFNYSETAGMTIPDNNPSGISSVLSVPDDIDICDIQVYTHIEHTFRGDLIVEVTSPLSTTVRLHDQSGGAADNIIGWYDSQFAVDGPGALEDFHGSSSLGDWTMFVSDNGSYDVGTLESWALRIWGRDPSVGIDREYVFGPISYNLAQNSPNPFNPTTDIAFALASDAEIDLSIYNLRGERVRTLASGMMTAGYHTITWDGRDENGQGVASGIYFYRIASQGFSSSKKMILMK